MSDNVKAILARVLADEWVPSRVVYGSDEPEGFSSHHAWAEYVADVILALPGVAVTQLPEPEEVREDFKREVAPMLLKWRYVLDQSAGDWAIAATIFDEVTKAGFVISRPDVRLAEQETP